MVKQIRTINGVRYRWDKPVERRKDPVLQNLQQFAMKSSRVFTTLPVEVTSGELPIEIKGDKFVHTFAAPYTTRLYPDDKRYKPQVMGYGVLLDETYFKENRADQYELQQTVLHELAHIAVDIDRINAGLTGSGHTPTFRAMAKQLGCDENHQRGFEQKQNLISENNPRYKRAIREHFKKNP
jgi:predicted SprT family Zn-dependent metalloprotease